MRALIAASLLLTAISFADDTLPQAFQQPPTIRQGQYVLWHEPGDIAKLDFNYGIGEAELAPAAPFSFLEEDNSGTTAKVTVRDAKGRQWSVKFGDEARAETFCTRLAWALGYYVEPNYFVANGVVTGVQGLQRARKQIDDSGQFHNARFQLRSKEPKFLRTLNWTWDDNPFVGTPELNGLRILMMLVSNWDDKDSRDSDSRGTNTGIYQQGNLYIYFIDDWGAAMGNWGKLLTRSKWNAADFAHQSGDFVSLKNGEIHWGYTGQHSELMTRDLKFSDVMWILQFLNRVTDQQLHAGLIASGASEPEAETFGRALRQRIVELQHLL